MHTNEPAGATNLHLIAKFGFDGYMRGSDGCHGHFRLGARGEDGTGKNPALLPTIRRVE